MDCYQKTKQQKTLVYKLLLTVRLLCDMEGEI